MSKDKAPRDTKPWEYIEELEIKIKELENFLEIKTSENTWHKVKIQSLEAKLAECVAENEQLKQELKMINEWAVKASLDDAFKAYHSLKETLAKVKK